MTTKEARALLKGFRRHIGTVDQEGQEFIEVIWLERKTPVAFGRLYPDWSAEVRVWHEARLIEFRGTEAFSLLEPQAVVNTTPEPGTCPTCHQPIPGSSSPSLE